MNVSFDEQTRVYTISTNSGRSYRILAPQRRGAGKIGAIAFFVMLAIVTLDRTHLIDPRIAQWFGSAAGIAALICLAIGLPMILFFIIGDYLKAHGSNPLVGFVRLLAKTALYILLPAAILTFLMAIAASQMK